ncbi:MAG: NAD(P)H-dependent oxidoreductase [Hyphomonas sp.]|nr:NAD(P)H-dependent oxidoreductase [Hyphomonas sp.]
MAHTLFHLNASARTDGSVTRDLSQRLVDQLSDVNTLVISRDIGVSPLPLLSEDWVVANFTPDDARTPTQRDTLSLSDDLVGELEKADTLVLGVPIYNFGVPAAFKAWIDLVARARKTFKYTDAGPVGLLEGKRAYVVIASGGTASGSEIDFATPYIRHVLGFLGIDDVTIIAADQLMATGDEKISAAASAIEAVAA